MAGAQKHIVHVFSTFVLGGPQRRTVDLFHSMPPRFRHTVLTIDNNFSAREAVRPGAPVDYANIIKDARGRVRRRELREQLLALKPDLCITYNWGATEAVQAMMLRAFAPMLHEQDGFGPDEAQAQMPRRLWARRFFYRFVEAVVVPSQNLERIATDDWWLPRRRVLYIPNGIDVNKYAGGNSEARKRFREALRIPAVSVVVCMVAHLRGEKAPRRLLRAFANGAPSGATLVFVGDGPERDALQNEARSLNMMENIRFAGHITEPVDAYHAMDIFALSSHTEQMPISVLEAMAAGLPVLSTDVGDIAAMVAPANRAFITNLADDAAFASALKTLATDAALRAHIGAANRDRCVAHYSLELQNNAYTDLYDRFSRPKSQIWRSEHYRN
ncbi:MAG: glycosyltransferase family 4 protein [Planctomycetes bacterium]|nr:glycosyltransferase family 4 protein [Planctomycetota bacterium]